MYRGVVIGYIPTDNRSEYISGGDPQGSGTFSEDWTLSEEEISQLEDSESVLWAEILLTANSLDPKKESNLDRERLLLAYRCACGEDEIDVGSGMILVTSDPDDDGGEFGNSDGRYSGRYYVRVIDSDEETDEISHEFTVVF